MSRKFVSPRDPLRYERQRVSDLERRAARAAATVKAGRQRASQDEVGEAYDELCVVLQEFEDAAKEVSFGSGAFDRSLYEALRCVGSGGAFDGEVEVADESPAIADYVRSWGYFVVSRANAGGDSDTASVN